MLRKYVNTTLTNQHGPIINLSGEKKPCMVGFDVDFIVDTSQ
jgi:hypothetical protein